jgi:DNA adenine methylase
MFFALDPRPRQAILSDIVPDLIETYEAVQSDVEDVIRLLDDMPYESEFYYDLRATRPAVRSERAARFIYLNKTCFNGLYRVNKRGDFNVPFGRHGKNLLICDKAQLRAASQALAGASIRVADFSEVVEDAKRGDLVYFDPPYTVAHSTNGFLEYNAEVFSWADQYRLARSADALRRKGVFVAISNADHHSIRKLYGERYEFKVITLPRWSTVAGSATKRFASRELILLGAPMRGGRRDLQTRRLK